MEIGPPPSHQLVYEAEIPYPTIGDLRQYNEIREALLQFLGQLQPDQIEHSSTSDEENQQATSTSNQRAPTQNYADSPER